MIAGAREWACRNEQEAFSKCNAPVGLEFLRVDVAFHLGMLAGRLKILADGEEIDVGAAQIIHELQNLLALFAQSNHDTGLSEHCRIAFLDLLQQPKRMKVPGSRANLEVEPWNSFQVVVEDVWFRGDDGLESGLLAQKIRGEDLNGRGRRFIADGLNDVDEVLRPAVGKVITVDRSYNDVFEAELGNCKGNVGGFLGVERGG